MLQSDVILNGVAMKGGLSEEVMFDKKRSCQSHKIRDRNSRQ